MKGWYSAEAIDAVTAEARELRDQLAERTRERDEARAAAFDSCLRAVREFQGAARSCAEGEMRGSRHHERQMARLSVLDGLEHRLLTLRGRSHPPAPTTTEEKC